MSDINRVLCVNSIRFFSPFDEELFFEWVEKISCVNECYGKGLNIFIDVLLQKIDEESLRELVALFFRYGIDMKQLADFETPENSYWFKSPASYWYSQVFS